MDCLRKKCVVILGEGMLFFINLPMTYDRLIII